MDRSNQIILPIELFNHISEDLTGMDLFHFTLATYYYLDITDYHLINLLDKQPNMLLIDETNALLCIFKSPYFMLDDMLAVVLSSNKCNTFVYGPFKINVIEKSLKFFYTNTFNLYSRLWSFTPFHYSATYPTLEIFSYACIKIILWFFNITFTF
jgi:hypothetical protein